MNAPAKIVILDRETLPPDIRLDRFDFPHLLESYDRTDPDEVAGRIRHAQIVITNKVRVGGADLQTAAELRLVAVAATGTDVIDLRQCQERSIAVCNIRNYAVHTVPEHTFALIFALRRSVVAYHNAVAKGRWESAGQFCFFDYPIRDLAGSTLGIIGDGVLGQAVGEMGKALGLKVLYAAYKESKGMGPLYTPFEDVLRHSDILTIHCPLMESTRNLIGAAEFALMDRHPLVINTARGGIVEEAALADALVSGQIGGAGFDVVTQEPMPHDHPFTKLMDRPDFILTPHVAWASREAIQTLVDQLIDNINAFTRGDLRNAVRAA